MKHLRPMLTTAGREGFNAWIRLGLKRSLGINPRSIADTSRRLIPSNTARPGSLGVERTLPLV